MTPATLRAILTGEVPVADATPEGIQASEKRGQTELVNSTTMPLELRPSREAFEALGFTFGEPIDTVFQVATLPPGWSRSATDHDMWSEIRDEAGKVKVNVFYKAAFYDRRADASIVTDEPT